MDDNLSSELERDTRAVLDAIRKIVRALRVASRAAEKRAGLSGAQLFVLQKLSDGRAVSLNELAARTLTHQSSVSVVVQRLVERGLIRRSSSAVDGRRIELSLTTAGRKVAGQSHDLAQDRLIRALREMPQAQRTQTAVLLDDLLARAGLYSESATLFFEDDGPTSKSGAPRKEK
jgi:DNA-binding MarR family transcriptional regulator